MFSNKISAALGLLNLKNRAAAIIANMTQGIKDINEQTNPTIHNYS
jgi:hypothetical protein